MFLWYWLVGLVHLILWRFGKPTGATAPSLKTAWSSYGLFGRR